MHKYRHINVNGGGSRLSYVEAMSTSTDRYDDRHIGTIHVNDRFI